MMYGVELRLLKWTELLVLLRTLEELCRAYGQTNHFHALLYD